MARSPVVYIISVEKENVINIQELEGYICDYSCAEEDTILYYYSSIQQSLGQEVSLTAEYLLEQTRIDYTQIFEELFVKKFNQENLLNYVENNIEHPLIRYRLKVDIENENFKIKNLSVDRDELVGAKVLLTVNPQYHKNQDVILTNQYFSQQGVNKQLKPVQQIAQYLNLVKENQNLLRDQEQIYSGLIVETKNIPQSYFDNQSKVSEEQGRGKIEIDDEYKQEMARILIKDQEYSLNSWLTYLQYQEYPTWYKTYVLEGLKKMGAYDKQRNRFSKRRKDYVGTFPELNREALAQVYDCLYKYHNGEIDEDEIGEELLNLLKTGSFVRLYEYFLVNTKGIIEWDREEINGKWVKFEQTEDKKPGEQLAKSLEGYNTGWCTAGASTAQEQLEGGDFYVYYTRNKLGFETAPRIAIRMEEDIVAEVRGIEPEQNLEGLMTPILQEKVKQLPGGKEYFVKTEHMKLLTHLKAKHDKGETLSKQELMFLYEIKEPVEGFGYEQDPRIQDILEARDINKDLSLCLGLKPEQIYVGNFSPKNNETLQDIRYIKGQLYIEDPQVTHIPDNLIVDELSIGERSVIKEIPGDITIKEYLFLRKNRSVKSLGQGIKVRKVIAKSSSLKILPENLEVDLLDIESCNIKKLPKGLKAKDVEAFNSQLEMIEEGCQIGELNIAQAKVTKLPHIEGLQTLIAENSPLQTLPDNFSAEDLYISHTPLTSLPKNIRVQNISASASNLQSLPKGLKAKYLILSHTKITKLPEGLQVSELDIQHSLVKNIGSNVKVDHLIADYSQIVEIPEDLQVRNLYVSETPLESLPNNFKAKKIYASKTSIEKLPEKLEADQLHLDYTNIVTIPKGFKVKNLFVNNTLLESIPDAKDSQIDFIQFDKTPLSEKYKCSVIRK